MWLRILLALVISTGLARGQGVQILPRDLPEHDTGGRMMPAVKADDTSWREGDPVWHIESGNVAADGYFAWTPQAVLVRIVVHDPEHKNEYHERNLWRGDCVYLAVDARGDNTAEQDATGELRLDDALYTMGLGTEGPECRLQHGDPARALVDGNELLQDIVRDEQAKTTAYDLRLPWEHLNTRPGQSPTMAFAVTVAHKNAEGQDQHWGKMRASRDRKTGEVVPRKLHHVAVEQPQGEFATVAPLRVRLLSDDEMAEATVALRLKAGGEVSAAVGGARRTRRVEPSDELRRFVVRVPGSLVGLEGAKDDVMKVRVDNAQAGAEGAFRLSSPSVVMGRFEQHVEKLMQTASHDAVRTHLRSTLRVVRRAYEALELERAEHPERVPFFMETVAKMQALLPEERMRWTDYTQKCLPLVFAFISERDHTLQFSYVQLPFNWNPEKTYPLTVYLHGAGHNNPLAGLLTAFDNSGQDTLFRRVDIDPDDVPPSHRGFVLTPWARGNSYYRHGGEDDVWQSIQYIRRAYKIDPERMYMTGFSMGCNGAWALAARTPDLWAGVNLASGFGEWSETILDYLVENMAGVPVKVWIGELDPMHEGALEFVQRVKDRVPVEAEIVPRTPHTYPYQQFQENVGYLMQFTRGPRPDVFTYLADTNRHTGRNGVYIRVPRLVDQSAMPWFKVVVDGQEVRVISRNTTGMAVQTGEGGLGLEGGVTVYWNGKQAYEGPSGNVSLGEGVPEWHRR